MLGIWESVKWISWLARLFYFLIETAATQRFARTFDSKGMERKSNETYFHYADKCQKLLVLQTVTKTKQITLFKLICKYQI